MQNKSSVLTASEAQAYYDKFGKKQDSQGFYEEPALNDLIAHAGFPEAQKVFEFGCGTGKFADRLLSGELSPAARYLCCDVSPTMTALAAERLADYADRAQVIRTEGNVQFPLTDQSVDRVVSNYVLDLLSEEDANLVFSEAHRVLIPGGSLCLVSLTGGVTLPSRIVSSLWMTVFRMRASLVGGCRPIYLESYADPERWQVEYRNVLTLFGVPSEILILARR